MMVPSVVEKFTFGIAVVVLVMQGRMHATDLVFAATDLLLGVLFVVAWVKTGGREVESNEVSFRGRFHRKLSLGFLKFMFGKGRQDKAVILLRWKCGGLVKALRSASGEIRSRFRGHGFPGAGVRMRIRDRDRN